MAREGDDETTEKEDEEEEENEERNRDKDTPWGPPVNVTRVGGTPPPQRKTQTSRDSPQKVRTCCCREYMETSRITTTGHTWTGE